MLTLRKYSISSADGSFGACPKNKQNLQLISWTFSQQKSTVSSAKMILSGFISDEDGISQGVESNNGKLFPILYLCSSIEEADGRIIPHIAKAIQSG